MRPDVTWSIGDITAQALIADEHPTFIPGESETLTFDVDETAGFDPPTAVFGGADGTTFGGLDGGTYSTDETPPGEQYQRLRSYLETPGTNATGTTLGGEVFVREYLADSAAVDSRIVKITPGDDVRLEPGFWVAIEGGEVLTRSPGPTTIALDVTYLARADDYGSRADLINDLQTPITQL